MRIGLPYFCFELRTDLIIKVAPALFIKFTNSFGGDKADKKRADKKKQFQNRVFIVRQIDSLSVT